MTKLRNISLSALVLAILLAVPSTVSAYAESSEQPNSSDEKALRSEANDYCKAYALGDAKTIANMWAPDGTYTDANGLELKGRSEIEKYFASGFKQCGAQPLEISIESIRFPRNDVAIEEGTCRVVKGPAAGIKSRYTVLHVKENGQWLAAAVTESEPPQQTSRDSLKDFNWLIGSWTAKGPKGTMHLKANWVGDDKFIHCAYATDNSSGPKSEQMQIIGWSPISRQVISWHFDKRGGYGSGHWLQDGQSFIEKANGVEPDGTTSSSINTLHKLTENSFTWRSTGRVLGNNTLADTPEITVTRDQ